MVISHFQLEGLIIVFHPTRRDMSALAVFTCRPNSHPFQERHIPVLEQVKIGRSVARARPAANNAIFDCKVLSRNHALLWYEDGKFLLQDTKSSNGTFVNNDRLSKGSEESVPRDIYSGDIIQFGVDVMENSRRGEEIVTHSCIIASVRLYYPDGQEATNDHSSSFLNFPGGTAVQSQELYQLAQYLQDALHREQMLENKLATLQRLVQSTQDASENGWQALIDEDRLLSRLEVLENQLQVYSKNQTEDSLRQELTALQEDKYNYETTAKESLRKVLEEKLEAVRKLADLERSLSNTEDECQHLRNMCESSQRELQELAEKHQQQLQEVQDLNEKLQDEERNHNEEGQRLAKEREKLENKLEEMVRQEVILQAKVESLQADNDFTKEQLANMRVKIGTIQDNTKDSDILRIPEFLNQGVQVDMVNLMDLKLLESECITDSSSDESEKVDNDIEMKDACTKQATDLLAELDLELEKEDMDEDDEEDSGEKMNEDELKDPASDLPQFPLDASADTSLEHSLSPEKLKETQASINYYKKLLADSEKLLKKSRDKIIDLENELSSAKSECRTHLATIASFEERLIMSETIVNEIVDKSLSDMKSQLEESKKQTEQSEYLSWTLKEQISGLEIELKKYKSQVIVTTEREADLPKTIDSTPKPPQQTQGTVQKEIAREVKLLKETLDKAEYSTKEVKDQILVLQGQLQQSQQEANRAKNESEYLKVKCEELERKAASLAIGVIASPTKSLREAKTSSPRISASPINKKSTSPQIHGYSSRVQEEHQVLSYPLSSTIKSEADFSSLKEECTHLRRRIQDIEHEMKMYRQENNQLKYDNEKLRSSYDDMAHIKSRLEERHSESELNLTDAQKDADITKHELVHANDEISKLNDQCALYKEDISRMRCDFSELGDEYVTLSYRSKAVSICSMIPLMLFLFGLLMAFYPALSQITATRQPENI